MDRNNYSTNILDHGNSGVCGEDENGNKLGGYYYVYNDQLLQQKWKYMYGGVDLFLDLNMFRSSDHYNPNRRWTHMIY